MLERTITRNGLVYENIGYRMSPGRPQNYAMSLHYSPSLGELEQKSLLWQELYFLAKDVVQAYYCDFYHDMAYLESVKITKSHTFYYLYGDTGTTIVDKSDSFATPERNALACRRYTRPYVYRIEIVQPLEPYSQQWPVFFTMLANEQGVLDYKPDYGTIGA